LPYAGQGNPLALREIARDLTPQQRRGEAPLDGSLPPSAEWAYLRRIEALAPDTRRALLLAALAEGGDRANVAQACASLGLDAAVLDPAERVWAGVGNPGCPASGSVGSDRLRGEDQRHTAREDALTPKGPR
jgi:hypothetical protein